jgi:hypothetical protein
MTFSDQAMFIEVPGCACETRLSENSQMRRNVGGHGIPLFLFFLPGQVSIKPIRELHHLNRRP